MFNTLLLLVVLLLHLFLFAVPQPDFVHKFCIDDYGNYTKGSTYESNLKKLLSEISSNTQISYGFYNFTVGKEPDQANGIGLCRGDVAKADCHTCLNDSIHKLTDVCPNQKEAIGWYSNCMLRYSNRSIFGVKEDHPGWWISRKKNATDQDQFGRAVVTLFGTLQSPAASGDSRRKFATGESSANAFTKLYAFSQCTPDLSSTDCYNCLGDSINRIWDKVGSAHLGGVVYKPSCNLRYETYKFAGSGNSSSPPESPPSGNTGNSSSPPESPPSGNNGKKKRKPVWMIAAISAVLATLICIFVCSMLYKKKSDEFPSDMDGITSSVRSLQFDLSMIKATTDNFSSDKMLGRGGFGAVYRGRLENGQEVAIKRLSGNSVQGIEEFKTEVAVVAKLQHRNLVKLLGFCLSKKEKILIYEYLSNSSLDKVLLDPVQRKSLDWVARSKIILGIAKGLLYLHQDSRLKIIHRDLKSSNILLDDTLNAKISDFGLARMLGVDQTQDGTNRIIGTYGYMAPEYAMTGHFSVKSDVYSFGIIVLELVSGQVNRFFNRPQSEEALLLRAWRLWEEEATMELVDPCFGNDYPMEEVAKCIHMGLLCIQGEAARRPDMFFIVGLLSGQSVELPPVAPSTLSSASNLCSVEESLEVGESQEVHNEKPIYV